MEDLTNKIENLKVSDSEKYPNEVPKEIPKEDNKPNVYIKNKQEILNKDKIYIIF